MDILKHGPEVEVLEPAVLRERVRELLNETLSHYGRGGRLVDVPAREASSAKGVGAPG